MTVGPTRYATDEDIAIRASADFALLVPKDQKLTCGNDGQFAPGVRWVLSSPSVDFGSQGLAPGHVVHLTQPVSLYKQPGEMLVVSEVDGGVITLRRKGQPEGVGQPPAPPGGVTQVEFSAVTFGPQIASASYELDRRFGIDDLIADRRSSDLFDPREVREVTVLTVLYRQYLDLCRGPEGHADSFAAKAQLYKQELDDLLARTIIHWLPVTGEGCADVLSSRFGTRISR